MTDRVDGLQDLDGSNSISSLNSLDSLAGIVILAGGASRRMGTAKAKLTLPTNESLLDYHVRQASKLNVPIIIADNGRGFTVDAELLSDNTKSPISYVADYGSTPTTDNNSHSHNGSTGGALVAIESALQSVTTVTNAGALKNEGSLWLMVISCDSLIPATDLWQKLQPFIAQSLDESVICLTDETHLYPLLGLYNLSIEPELKTYIDSGQRQVMRFIESRVQAIALPKSWQHLTNFNTPENFKQACVALKDL